MMKMYFALLTYFVFWSTGVYSQDNGESAMNAIQETTLKDKQLISFLETYADEQKQAIYILHMNKENGHHRSYELYSPGYWKAESTAPLAFARYKDTIVLIFSGIEGYFPSSKRKESLLALLNGKIEILTEKDIPPNVDNSDGKLVVCGNGRILEQKIGFNVNTDPCIIEEPPLDEN